MEQVVDRIAELTGLRDRGAFDVTLVGVMRDLLKPLSVGIYGVVGNEGDLRWIMRARLDAGDVSAVSDSMWSDPLTLAPLDAQPERAACLKRQASISLTGTPAKAFFPLSTDLETVAVLELHTAAPIDDAGMRLIACMLRVFRNFQSLLDDSERDTLTGLLNRKTFDENLLRAVCQVHPSALPPGGGERRLSPTDSGPGRAWLGVIDIDHFKRVNDAHGHLIGDEVLLLMSRLMRSCFRLQDRLYRFGGEEFVVLLHCAHAHDAMVAFERLRAHVERYAFPQVGRITVSIGFAALRSHDTPASAFGRADRTVYWVKQNGRNAVAHYADLVGRGLLVEADSAGNAVELF